MKYAIIAIVVAFWLWSYYRVIRLTNRILRKLYSLQIDIEQVAPQSGRLRLLLVAPAVYAKIVFSTIRDAIICSSAMFLVWWYDRKGKKEEQE